MKIICRLATLFKVALMAWAAGALIGFWAGQHAVPDPDHTLAGTSEPLSGTTGMYLGKGGELEWRLTPSWS